MGFTSVPFSETIDAGVGSRSVSSGAVGAMNALASIWDNIPTSSPVRPFLKQNFILLPTKSSAGNNQWQYSGTKVETTGPIINIAGFLFDVQSGCFSLQRVKNHEQFLPFVDFYEYAYSSGYAISPAMFIQAAEAYKLKDKDVTFNSFAQMLGRQPLPSAPGITNASLTYSVWNMVRDKTQAGSITAPQPKTITKVLADVLSFMGLCLGRMNLSSVNIFIASDVVTNPDVMEALLTVADNNQNRELEQSYGYQFQNLDTSGNMNIDDVMEKKIFGASGGANTALNKIATSYSILNALDLLSASDKATALTSLLQIGPSDMDLPEFANQRANLESILKNAGIGKGMITNASFSYINQALDPTKLSIVSAVSPHAIASATGVTAPSSPNDDVAKARAFFDGMGRLLTKINVKVSSI